MNDVTPPVPPVLPEPPGTPEPQPPAQPPVLPDPPPLPKPPATPQQPVMSEETPVAQPYPFWNYGDLLWFAGLAVPSILIGELLVKGVFLLFHLHPDIKVVELLPAQFIGYAILFGALAAVFRMKYNRPFWPSLAWNPIPIPFMLVMLSGMLTGFLVAIASSLIHLPDTGNPLTDLLEGRTAIILVALFGVTLGPLCEELGFRGFLQPLLVRSLGTAPGILLAAIPFGLLHYQEYGDSWRHALLISAAGTAFGIMRHFTGSTKAAVLMHAAYNSLFFLVLFAEKRELSHGW